MVAAVMATCQVALAYLQGGIVRQRAVLQASGRRKACPYALARTAQARACLSTLPHQRHRAAPPQTSTRGPRPVYNVHTQTPGGAEPQGESDR
jgi:hypothetical protein